MTYFTLIANCLAMVIGFYLVYDEQFILGVVCFLISFIGFRQLCIELDKKQKVKAKKIKKIKKLEIFKPKLKKDIKAQIRSNKFFIN